jgi:aspartyl-tRNA(Asn)/glutamyl-tRNA(Gln) amidotransferase subunit A
VQDYRHYHHYRKQLESGEANVPDTVRHYLSRIAQHNRLNAFLEVFEDEALRKAQEVQAKIAAGKGGKLAGMVVAIKDNLSIRGHKVSNSSKILEGFEAVYTATAVQRLIDEDAILIGRTNCDEFAMGSSNENSAFGPVLNPLDEARVPGGSSGGSAAAVAAGLCMAALGTDTGGSIRQPASLCGLVGLKPTYGRISRYGLLAYASSFDQIGPMTTNVEDAALLLEVMAGPDEFDSTLSQRPAENYSDFEPVNGKRIGYWKEAIESPGLNPEVRQRTEELLANLRDKGYTTEPYSFPFLDYMVPAYYILTTAEASSNLSRYDGIHYGYRHPEARGVEQTYSLSRSAGFGPEVQRRIMLGTFVLSSGYYDAYYAKGQKVRRVIREKTRELFHQFDFLLFPTAADVAFKIGENAADPIKMYLQDIFTVQANLAGVPAISLPLGKNAEGLPFGIQLTADLFCEKELLNVSKELAEEFAF